MFRPSVFHQPKGVAVKVPFARLIAALVTALVVTVLSVTSPATAADAPVAASSDDPAPSDPSPTDPAPTEPPPSDPSPEPTPEPEPTYAEPVTASDDFSASVDMRWGVTYRLDLVGNDYDPNGLPLSVESCDRVANVYSSNSNSPELAFVSLDGGSILLTPNQYYSGELPSTSFNCYITNGEQSSVSQISFSVHDPSYHVFKPLKIVPSIGRANRFRVINPNVDQRAVIKYSRLTNKRHGRVKTKHMNVTIPSSGSTIACTNKPATTITSYVVYEGKLVFIGVDTLFKKIRKKSQFRC